MKKSELRQIIRESIEEDGALDRRFQKVNILPPSIKESIEILNGLKINYEKHHNVKFNSNAIKACVELSERYISDKFLPDKAIDVMDEAGSKLHIQNLKDYIQVKPYLLFLSL